MKNINFKILNFDAVRNTPVFKESRSGEYIEYGSDNAYPPYLLDIFHNKSNKHKAIISKKVDMTTGNGFTEPATQNLNSAILSLMKATSKESLLYNIIILPS